LLKLVGINSFRNPTFNHIPDVVSVIIKITAAQNLIIWKKEENDDDDNNNNNNNNK
jgi:hypothetical protein